MKCQGNSCSKNASHKVEWEDQSYVLCHLHVGGTLTSLRAAKKKWTITPLPAGR